MFLPALFIAIGLAILLNTFGLGSSTLWGLFWAIFFIAVGIKIMTKRGSCPMCGWGHWHGKMHERFHEKMSGHCCDHDQDQEGETKM